MPKGRSSQTAEFALLARAAHQLLESPPLVLDDPISLSLITADQLHERRNCPDAHLTPAALGIRTHIVVRSRFAEDCLGAAIHLAIAMVAWLTLATPAPPLVKLLALVAVYAGTNSIYGPF